MEDLIVIIIISATMLCVGYFAIMFLFDRILNNHKKNGECDGVKRKVSRINK